MTPGTQRAGRRTAVVLLLLCALVVAGAGWELLRDDDPVALPAAAAARPAEAFVDSVGVNIHMTYYDTAYARFDEWLARLDELGVRHVRDGLIVGDPIYVERYRRLAAAGHRASFIVNQTEGPADGSVALAAGPLRGVVGTLEGPNEPDLFTTDSWEDDLRLFLPTLRRAVDARLGDDAVPLLAPSLVEDGSRERVDDIAGLWEVENVHPYPGGEPPLPPLDTAADDRPLMATETGYHNALAAQDGQPPVSEAAAGAYVPRLLAEHFAAGIERTFLYELIDEKPDATLADPEQHFGLLRQDLSRKPAFNALRNMLDAIASSPGEGPGRDVVVERPDDDLRQLLLERDDGSRALLLWRRLPLWDTGAREPIDQTTSRVGLRFASEARDIQISYPSRAAAPIERPDGSRLDVLVGADVVVVSFR